MLRGHAVGIRDREGDAHGTDCDHAGARRADTAHTRPRRRASSARFGASSRRRRRRLLAPGAEPQLCLRERLLAAARRVELDSFIGRRRSRPRKRMRDRAAREWIHVSEQSLGDVRRRGESGAGARQHHDDDGHRNPHGDGGHRSRHDIAGRSVAMCRAATNRRSHSDCGVCRRDVGRPMIARFFLAV